MNKKKTEKEEAFDFFCKILDEEYEEVFHKPLNHDVKNTELYKQKVLYFSCLFSEKQKLFNTFNNWQAWVKGPVEVDIHNYMKR